MSAVLHVVYGKPAAGKSTLTAALGAQAGTVVVSEDAWLAALFGDRLTTLRDYREASGRLCAAMGPHISALLAEGLSVVLDFPANTREMRTWMRETAGEGRGEAVLHVLDVPDVVCLERLRARNASGTHPFTLSETQFHQIVAHLEPPAEDEGFALRPHPI